MTSKKILDEIMALMSDGKTRSTAEISTILTGAYRSTFGKAVGELRDDGKLEWVQTGEVVSPHIPRLYRLAREKEQTNEPDNNPFLWRTFKQPEVA